MSEASQLYHEEMTAELRARDRCHTVAGVCDTALENMRATAAAIDKALVGRRVAVLSDHNGQPYGRSRPSWKGQVARVKSVYVDLYNGVSLCLEGHESECFISADEVTFELPTNLNVGDKHGT